MHILTLLQDELRQEFETTKKFIELFPNEGHAYMPHPKSMKMDHLATHIVEIFSWANVMLKTSFLDLSTAGDGNLLTTRDQLLKRLVENYEASESALHDAEEAELSQNWALKHGEHVLAQWSKYGAIRHALSQISHHRAQLGVY
ncbi:DinB family protein [Sphingobacterium suaedae]|uniref:DinB family protein n=1 Tax=Sphingobacterium suaedae TaxID=1686402 RepID=A0ABW5KDA8_9SPHI